MTPTPRIRSLTLCMLALALLLLSTSHAPVEAQAPDGDAGLGLVHINSAETPRSTSRIARGVQAGAGFDRFPLYWNNVERTRGRFDWGLADRALKENEAAGLDTLLVLLGTAHPHYPDSIPPVTDLDDLRAEGVTDPAELYADAQRCTQSVGRPPHGLDQPIFADGTDQPARGKAVNPENPWASYVHLVASRYAPGGIAGTTVTHWEIWNEPDLCQFWSGTPAEYARLLKTAYLVIKQVDADATVMWGGLAHHELPEFLPALVHALQRDADSTTHKGFFDAAASHHYSDVTHATRMVQRIRSALAGTGWGNKPVWITESGVPVCGDEIGPACPSHHRASPAGQAAYIWQNLAFSRQAGAAAVFHFQLFDDCGNDNRAAPPADAFGLVTNDGSASCVPHRAENRPSYQAFQLAAQYLAGGTLVDSETLAGNVRSFTFYDRASGEQRTLLFTMGVTAATVEVPASTQSAFTLRPDGTKETRTAENGIYRIQLEGSTNPKLGGSSTYIGGTPVLLVEQVGVREVAELTLLEGETGESALTEGNDTAAGAGVPDRTAPTVALEIVPYDGTLFELGWHVEDASGIPDEGVELWIRVDGGAWLPYLTGQPASASTFIEGEPGARYHFGAYAIDRYGNASDLDPDAVVEIALSNTSTGR